MTALSEQEKGVAVLGGKDRKSGIGAYMDEPAVLETEERDR